MTEKKYFTLDELFSRDEEERLAKVKAEMAAEKAAWDALPQEEKDRVNAEREKFWESMEDNSVDSSEDDEDEDDQDDEEEDDDD